jgi:multisubunit Na+/H+ antiporter MnhG subunit
MEHKHEPENNGAMRSKANIALIIFLIIGAFFVVTEHRAHLVGLLPYLPYLLLLACPLMHLFMHGGHHHGSHQANERSNDSAKEKK